jgi:hypothetical protein
MWKLLRKVSVVALALALLLPVKGDLHAGQQPVTNLACMTTATTGTGTVTLGAAVSGFLSFASSGVTDGSLITYAIEDGVNTEIGRGTYTTSGTTLSRTTIYNSTNAGSAISLSGSAKVCVTPSAGDFLGASNYFLSLVSNQTGSNSASAQTWFPGGGATTLTVPGTTTYMFEGTLRLVRSAGDGSTHNIRLDFNSGSATFSSLSYFAIAMHTAGPVAPVMTRVDTGGDSIVTSSDNTTNENNIIFVKGIMRVSTGGTIIPRFRYSVAPGGAPTVGFNTYIRFWPVGSNSVLSFGPWS